MPSRIDGPRVFAEHFRVSRETMGRLEVYAGLLVQWQATINLVAPSTLGDIWHRHFADSAQILPLAPPLPARWLDLGSGAGFPGLVMAIMLAERGACRVSLVESDARKAAFLREVIRQTGIAVDIVLARIEIPSTQAKVGHVDVISARALAPLPKLIGLAAPFWMAGTTGLFLKGRDVAAEIANAEAAWDFSSTSVPSLTDAEGRIVVIRELVQKTEG